MTKKTIFGSNHEQNIVFGLIFFSWTLCEKWEASFQQAPHFSQIGNSKSIMLNWFKLQKNLGNAVIL